jgi:hypothetical protein
MFIALPFNSSGTLNSIPNLFGPDFSPVLYQLGGSQVLMAIGQKRPLRS